jgi:hypothetical protein
LVFGCGAAIHGRNPIMVGALNFHVVVVGANMSPVLHFLGEGWPKLHSPLNSVRNSSVQSSIMARCGVDAQL